jgi:hypothetical protein
MESHTTKTHTPSVQQLTGPELHDFDLVVGNAKSMGWLTPEQQLSAVRTDSMIVVRALIADPAHERSYQDGHRWLYQLLHELAQGLWKAKPIADASDATRC